MKDILKEILYGTIYQADPGSERGQEQDRRIGVAIALMEEEMAKKKKKEDIQSGEKPATSFREKMILKKHEEEKEVISEVEGEIIHE